MDITADRANLARMGTASWPVTLLSHFPERKNVYLNKIVKLGCSKEATSRNAVDQHLCAQSPARKHVCTTLSMVSKVVWPLPFTEPLPESGPESSF